MTMPMPMTMTIVSIESLCCLIDHSATGKARGDRGEDEQRHAVADAALGDELTEPHDEAGAGGHRDDHDQDRHAAVARARGRPGSSGTAPPGFRAIATSVVDCRIARPMVRYRVYWVSFAVPALALFLERLEARDDHREQLDDDARRDVRHDPQREDRQLQQRPAAEEVDQAEAAVGRGRRCTPGRLCSPTPGVGMNEPRRKIAMIAMVNSSLRRRSGVRKARANAESTTSSCAPPGGAAVVTTSSGP